MKKCFDCNETFEKVFIVKDIIKLKSGHHKIDFIPICEKCLLTGIDTDKYFVWKNAEVVR